MKAMKKIIAAALCAAMVITLAPADAGAAKKVKLSNKAVSVKVGQTKKISVKNGAKKAKVTWKTTNKKVVTIASKNGKGNKAFAKVKGVSAGKAAIKATYKLGKKKTSLTCNVTVTAVEDNQNAATVAPGAASAAPSTSAGASAAPTTKSPATKAPATKAPTAKPTKTPTASPTPSPTPVPVPDGQIYMTYTEPKIDGTIDDAWAFSDTFKIDKWMGEGTAQSKNCEARMLYSDKTLYVMVKVEDPAIDDANEDTYKKDSVELFIDETNQKTGYEVDNVCQYRHIIATNTSELSSHSNWKNDAITSASSIIDAGKATQAYVVEFKVPLSKAPKKGDFVGFEIQVNDCSAGDRNGTWNMFSNPAEEGTDPYSSAAVFGDAQYAVKTETKVITLAIDPAHCNMELPSQFQDNTEMNSKAKFETGAIYAETANNVVVYFPDGRTVVAGEKAKVKITGTYTAPGAADGDTAFRVWMVDTKGGTLKGDNPVTTSNQALVTAGDTGIAGAKFTYECELTAQAGSSSNGDDSDGTCDGIMIKAPTWNSMIGNLVINEVVITVEDPIRNDIPK